MCTGTLRTMPVQDRSTHTPNRAIRVPDGRWSVFGAIAGVRDRARIINDFIAWYSGEEGAELPVPVDMAVRLKDGRVLLVEAKHY